MDRSKREFPELPNLSPDGFNPILIFLLVGSLIAALLTIVQAAEPARNWYWIMFPLSLVSLEAYLTTSWLFRPEQRLLEKRQYRLAELFLLVIFIRITSWWFAGNWPDFENWYLYLVRPGTLFADGFFWVFLLFGLLTWERTTGFTRQFSILRLEPAEKAFLQLPPFERRQKEVPLNHSRGDSLNHFANQWVWGGIAMIFVAGMTLVDYTDFTDGYWTNILAQPMSEAMLFSLIIYFLVGFLLLSQGRHTLMQVRWLYSNLEIDQSIVQTWRRNTMWLLLIIGLIAAFLPLGSTNLIGQIIEWIIFAAFAIFNFLFYLLFFILSLLFPSRESEEVQELEPPIFIEPEPLIENLPPPEQDPLPLAGGFFWIAIFILIGVTLIIFIRERRVNISWAGWPRWWQLMMSWIEGIFRYFSFYAVDLRDSLISRFVADEDGDSSGRSPWRFIRLNALSPKQKIRYFYFSTIQRAEAWGQGRDDSETPLEYAEDLKEGWPDAEISVDVLTKAFLKARYSPNEITSEDVTASEPHWKNLRARLRRSAQKEG